MKAALSQLNAYLEPGDCTREAAEAALTSAGFPIESAETLPSGDVLLDVEVTSNRGDCLCHIGMAREIAAITGRRLRRPPLTFAPSHRDPNAIEKVVHIDNLVAGGDGSGGPAGGCALFTGLVVQGVRVGPSPAWLVKKLEAVGQRSINNIVDASNFVLFEYGQPTHTFDLRTIAPGRSAEAHIVVRWSLKGEKLLLLDGREISLTGDELVVADTRRAIGLAGIMGGRETEVTGATTDVLIEAATWEPAAVRRAARRFGIRTDASHRFERVVDPRTIETAALRVADLIVQTGGGQVYPTMVHAGRAPAALTRIVLRPERCRAILGMDVDRAEMVRVLESLEISCAPVAGAAMGELECLAPAHRPDLLREIDLIEEVARVRGIDLIPVHQKLPIRISPPQASERAMRELGSTLTGLGFFETVTFSFASRKDAAAFLPKDLVLLETSGDRRRDDPALRPSILPGLLASRRANQYGRVTSAGGIRLFETASVFAQVGAHPADTAAGLETVNLALLADCESIPGGKSIDAKQMGFRVVKGAIEALVRSLGGARARVEFSPVEEVCPVNAFDFSERGGAAAVTLITLQGEATHIGTAGLIRQDVQKHFDLEIPVAAAEMNLGALLALFPPKARVEPLPAFPHIERDLSPIVDESVRWSVLERTIREARVALMEDLEFVGTFRGGPIDAGRKSVTVRMRFRDPSRTLRREEVDPQIEELRGLLGRALNAAFRG